MRIQHVASFFHLDGFHGVHIGFVGRLFQNGPSVPVFALELDKLSAEGSAALAADESLGACEGQPDDIAVLCTKIGRASCRERV